MTYGELSYRATKLYTKGKITLDKYMEMTKPLNREIEQEPILDQIRAEIKQLPRYGAKFLNGYFTVHVDVDEVLQIIDKYRDEVDCRECKAEYECYECEKYGESEKNND